ACPPPRAGASPRPPHPPRPLAPPRTPPAPRAPAPAPPDDAPASRPVPRRPARAAARTPPPPADPSARRALPPSPPTLSDGRVLKGFLPEDRPWSPPSRRAQSTAPGIRLARPLPPSRLPLPRPLHRTAPSPPPRD